MGGPKPIRACGNSWRTAVASTCALEWRSTSSGCESLSGSSATFIPSGSGPHRTHTGATQRTMRLVGSSLDSSGMGGYSSRNGDGGRGTGRRRPPLPRPPSLVPDYYKGRMKTKPFQLPPQYAPHAVERRLYQRWLDSGAFTGRADSPEEPYVIVIPPPNVTAVLHMGHGLNNVIQDVLIRFERMRGREAEWLPGTDHAGIATQNVVERLLAEGGKTRADVGRGAFVARVWAFVRETGNAILEQLKVIGCSCDWSRTRFTFDAAYSRAVREVFVTLWEEGLIYRGHRVIHWCPHCRTALSDEEAEFADEMGTLYYIRYPVEAGPKPFLTVATTRPETLLGDTAVAVHPRDKRHAGFIGKTARLPIADVPIPIIADEAVDPKFGTGFVKVTPAHDANDFEIGLRHHLPMPLIMREDGSMGEEAGTPKGLPDGRGEGGRVPPPLQGLDRFEAREKIVQMLRAQGLLEKAEPHQHAVRH